MQAKAACSLLSVSPMLLRVGAIAVLLSSAAWAQADVRADVRAALEEQVPVPSKPLVLPQLAPDVKRVKSSETGRRAAESARARADEAAKANRGLALGHLPKAAKDEAKQLGQAGQSATGQARAEEVRKNARGGKPRPPKP